MMARKNNAKLTPFVRFCSLNVWKDATNGLTYTFQGNGANLARTF